MATHNLSQARRLGDEVSYIYGGKIVELAGPGEFFDNPKERDTPEVHKRRIGVLTAQAGTDYIY